MAVRPRFVLASASPRREVLLAQAGIVPDSIAAPDVDETPRRNELPRSYALRVASDKARVIAGTDAAAGALALAADTVVACGRRILPKAHDAGEVERCLRLLSGRQHSVLTAIVLVHTSFELRSRIVLTKVAFKQLSDEEIAAYLISGEGVGKAGGYAVQGRAECFVRRINGSYSNVVGLPLRETVSLLRAGGYPAS